MGKQGFIKNAVLIIFLQTANELVAVYEGFVDQHLLLAAAGVDPLVGHFRNLEDDGTVEVLAMVVMVVQEVLAVIIWMATSARIQKAAIITPTDSRPVSLAPNTTDTNKSPKKQNFFTITIKKVDIFV